MLFTDRLPLTLDVAGATVEYVRLGAGPPLLYLHGFDGVSPDDSFLSPLGAHFDVIAPNLPGFGSSTRSDWTRTVPDLADDVRLILRALEIERVVLVGSSFGGWVASELVCRSSRQISHLVLADAVGARFSSDPLASEIVDIFVLPRDRYLGVLFADDEFVVASRLHFDALTDEALVRYCSNREGLSRYGWAPLLHDPELAQRIPGIDVPTLVLWGAEDNIVAVDYGRSFASAIPRSTFHVVPGAGHYLPLERPEEFAARVASFVMGAET